MSKANGDIMRIADLITQRFVTNSDPSDLKKTVIRVVMTKIAEYRDKIFMYDEHPIAGRYTQ